MKNEDKVLAIPMKVLSADETFAVMLVKSLTHNGANIMASGNLPISLIGCPIELFGSYTDNGKKRGKSMKVSYWEMANPQTVGTLQKVTRALKMDLNTAEISTLFNAYRDKTLEVLKNSPEDITSVLPNLSDKKLEQIKLSCKETFLTQEVTRFLSCYSQPLYLTDKVIRKFGDRFSDLKKNPYLLCQIDGVSFTDLDKKVKWVTKENFNPKFTGRVAAGIIHSIKLHQMSGDVCVKPDVLLETVIKTLGLMPSEAKQYLNQAVKQDALRMFGGYIYLAETEEAEFSCAKQVFDILHSPVMKKKPEEIAKAIEKAEKQGGLKLGEMQKEAIEKAHKNAFSIITGGPGCGKTTCINQLIKSFLALKPDCEILAAAPTGRAARRLAEATGLEAKTLHSVLQITKGSKYPKVESLDADLIIIDEFSMCDVFLAEAFFNKVKIGRARVVLVGDVDQLPSVDCGNVFADLIDSKVIPTTVLDTTYRQADGSAIIENAKRINENCLPLKNADDFQLVATGDKKIVDATLNCVKYALKSFKASDIMVLSPFRKSESGASAMNKSLQQLLNPPAPSKAEYKYYDTIFREGDRVMQLENDAERDVYNGDIGYITNIITKTKGNIKKGIEVKFETGNVQFYTASMLKELQLAFCITIHKSQGSEFPCAIVMFNEEYGNFRQKKLLYTAVTRAKQKVMLVSDAKSVAFASSQASPFEKRRRNSYLAARLVKREEEYKKSLMSNNVVEKQKKPEKNAQIKGQMTLSLA